MSITRRDFLNGVALSVAAGLTPAAQLAAQPGRYPPALMGLRGQHDGSFEIAHAFAREGRRLDFGGLPIDERYDLVVVGGGLSGLSAAWFYRRKNPQARILILDNHDDFGGHAKRNEFTIGERRIIGYGGSQSFQSPNSFFGPAAKDLLRELGVDIKRFETAFDRDLYPSLGLSRGVFFPRETFGRDVLVTGDAPRMNADETARRRSNARPLAEFVADFPISEASKAQYLALYSAEARSARRPHSPARSCALLKRTSYRDYLDQDLRLQRGGRQRSAGPHARLLRARRRRGAGGGRARSRLSGLRGPRPRRRQRRLERALHLSFPRRQRVAGAAAGALAHSRRRAGQHHGRRGAGAVRLRQARRSRCSRSASGSTATCLDVRNAGDEVQVGYVRGGTMHRVAGKHVVLACFHMVIPHIMPELPARAARGAGEERQDADRLHQRDGAQLARLREPQGQRHRRADVVPPSGVARFSGQPRRLSPHARSGPSRSACISSTCRARRTRGSTRAPSSASARASCWP